jgi:hypothetical protein
MVWVCPEWSARELRAQVMLFYNNVAVKRQYCGVNDIAAAAEDLEVEVGLA